MQHSFNIAESGTVAENMGSEGHAWLSERVIHYPEQEMHADVCIVGAGVAGTALAWCLAGKGLNVVLIERDYSEPDKFIGELLQPGGAEVLRTIGMEDVLEGIDAQVVNGYALFNQADDFGVSYPKLHGAVMTGRGFRYGKFIMNLRKKVATETEVQLVRGSALGLLESSRRGVSEGVTYKSADGAECIVRAPLNVLCDGAFSRFRKNLAESQSQTKGFMVGLLLRGCDLPYKGHGHVFLTSESPCLAYPVSSDEVRVLIDFPGSRSPKTSGKLEPRLDELRQLLPEGMKEAFDESARDPKVKAMPTQLLAARPAHGSGVLLIGDALNMRHPLTGGGMTVALSDVALINSLLTPEDLQEPNSLRNVVAAFYHLRHKSDASINILADALYDVMKYPDLKDACFEYLSQGPGYTAGPITILSAVSRNTNLLLTKFTEVALYAARAKMKPFRGLSSIGESYRIMRQAAHIVRPLVMNERPSPVIKLLSLLSYIVFPGSAKSRPQ